MTRLPADDAVVPVLVVGAGPVGVSAAILLAQHGVESLVIDKWDDIYPLPRAVHLDDEIYRVLADLGVAEAFAGITMPTLGLRLIDAKQRTMAEFRRSDPVGVYGFPPANMFDQPDLERLLRDRLADLPDATLVGGTELVSVEHGTGDDEGLLLARLRTLATGEEQRVRARAVLGCDGANSTVRGIIGATLEDLGFEERWLVADVRCERELPIWQGAHQLCDPRRAGTLMRVGPDRYRWEFRLHDGETIEELLASGELAALVQPWLGDVRFDDLEVLKRAEYTFKARIADRWRDGRVFLLGDAAHLTPPFIGQGLCAGLRDAANLTWKLAAVLQGRAHESLLATYEQERRPHAKALVKKAVMVGWAMTGGQDGAAHVRRAALAVATRLPGVSDKLLDAKPPRFADGAAVSRSGRRDRVTGGLLPQPLVVAGGRTVRLDEATGPGHLVLVVGEPDPGLVQAAGAVGARVVSVVGPGARVRAVAGPADAADLAVPLVVTDDEGALLTWFRRSGTSAVLVRPDHVVQARETSGAARPGAVLAAQLQEWSRRTSWQPTASSTAGGTR